jgi:hypothetical protein
MRPVHILAILAIFAIAACAGDSDDSSGMRVDTIAGIPRVTNTGNGAWAPGDAWTVEEAGAVIGGAPICRPRQCYLTWCLTRSRRQ